MSRVLRSSRLALAVPIGIASALFCAAAPVDAASHKARLSADLADHLNAGSQSIGLAGKRDRLLAWSLPLSLA